MSVQNEVLKDLAVPLLNEEEVARRLCCSVALLRKWRQFGTGPTYYKVGRLVRYSEADLKVYIDSCRQEAA